MLEKILRRLKRPTRYPREAVVLMLTAFATEMTLSRMILQRLPEETITALGNLDPIETPLLDLWIINEAVVRTPNTLSDEHIQSLIDGFHLESYRQFLSQALSDGDLRELQGRLRNRYTQYGELLTELLQGSTGAPFALARVVTRNLFGRETSDPVVAVTIGGSVSAAIFSVINALKDVLPRTDFQGA